MIFKEILPYVFLISSIIMIYVNIRSNSSNALTTGLVLALFFLVLINQSFSGRLASFEICYLFNQTIINYTLFVILLFLTISQELVKILWKISGYSLWYTLTILFYWGVTFMILIGLIPTFFFYFEMDWLALIYQSNSVDLQDKQISLNEFLSSFMDGKKGSLSLRDDIQPSKELNGKAYTSRTLPDGSKVVCVDLYKQYERLAEGSGSTAPKIAQDAYYNVTKAVLNRKDLECHVVSPPVQENYPKGYPDQKK